jgi:hypothetical protein
MRGDMKAKPEALLPRSIKEVLHHYEDKRK